MRKAHTLTAACCWMTAAVALAAAPAGFEQPPILSAREVAPAQVLQGPHHRVGDEVVNDGYLNTYSLESDFGPFEVRGEDLLRERVREVAALAQLAEVSRSEAFAKALAGAAMRPVETATNVVMNPVETAKGLPSGVSRYFKRTARKVKKTAKKVDEELSEDEDESAVEAGGEVEEAAGEAGEPAGEDEAGKGSVAKTKEVASDTTKRYLGVNRARREWAQKLGIDPYSSNEVLQRELGRVASAASVGGFAVRMVTPGFGGLDYLGEVNDLVWTMSSADLEVLNVKRLKEIGLGKAEIEELLESSAYSPSRLTGLVAALHGLADVPGRDALARLAGAAASEEETFFFQRSAEMLRVYHGEVAALRAVQSGPVWGGGVTADGTFVMALALDYLAWTEEVAAALEPAAERYRGRDGVGQLELWLAGRASPLARQELEALGWRVEERVRERWRDAEAPGEGPGR